MPEDLEEFGPKAERLKLLEELQGLFGVKVGSETSKENLRWLYRENNRITMVVTGDFDVYLSHAVHSEMIRQNGLTDFVEGCFYDPDKIEYYPGSDRQFRIIFSELLTRYRDRIGGEVFLETLRMASSGAVKKFFSQ